MFLVALELNAKTQIEGEEVLCIPHSKEISVKYASTVRATNLPQSLSMDNQTLSATPIITPSLPLSWTLARVIKESWECKKSKIQQFKNAHKAEKAAKETLVMKYGK